MSNREKALKPSKEIAKKNLENSVVLGEINEGKPSIKIVALIRRCDFCPHKESCFSLPDEYLKAEATYKLLGCCIAYASRAEVYENDKDFEKRLKELVGFTVRGSIVRYVPEIKENNRVIHGFQFLGFYTSPMIVYIDYNENSIEIVGRLESLKTSNQFKGLVRVMEELAEKYGIKHVLKASYEECVKLLKLQRV